MTKNKAEGLDEEVNVLTGYGDFAYYYDDLTGNVNYEKMSEYIYGLLTENGVGEGILLDLACGTGTLSFLLEQKGFDVIGVDGSEDMLSIAQQKKYELGSDAVFLCQKMQDLDLYGTIDAAVCTLDGINHVTSEQEVEKIFQKVALFMNDRGLFVFDVNTPFKHKEILSNNTFVYDLDDVFCVWQNSLLSDGMTVKISLDIFEKDGDSQDEEEVYYRRSEEFFEKAYDLEALKTFLEKFRFEVLGIFDGETHGKVGEKTQRAVFVCRKHGTQFI